MNLSVNEMSKIMAESIILYICSYKLFENLEIFRFVSHETKKCSNLRAMCLMFVLEKQLVG